MAGMKAKHGRDKILMFRSLKDAATGTAAKLALQTSHEFSYSRTTDLTQTKDGGISSGGGLEVTLDINAIITDDEVNQMLFDSVINGEKIEVWEIDLASGEADGPKKALYAQGMLQSWSNPADVESLETLTTTMTIDGRPQAGTVTLSAEQQEEITYAFRDIEPYTGG